MDWYNVGQEEMAYVHGNIPDTSKWLTPQGGMTVFSSPCRGAVLDASCPHLLSVCGDGRPH